MYPSDMTSNGLSEMLNGQLSLLLSRVQGQLETFENKEQVFKTAKYILEKLKKVHYILSIYCEKINADIDGLHIVLNFPTRKIVTIFSISKENVVTISFEHFSPESEFDFELAKEILELMHQRKKNPGELTARGNANQFQ